MTKQLLCQRFKIVEPCRISLCFCWFECWYRWFQFRVYFKVLGRTWM